MNGMVFAYVYMFPRGHTQAPPIGWKLRSLYLLPDFFCPLHFSLLPPVNGE
jgi:hypothetical protein